MSQILKLLSPKRRGQTSDGMETVRSETASSECSPLTGEAGRWRRRGLSGLFVRRHEIDIEEYKRMISDLALRQYALEERRDQMARLAAEHIGSGDRQGAVQALKRKRMISQEIQYMDATRFKLEAVIFDIESAITQQKTYGALSDLTSKHKNLLKLCSVDRVQRLMDELHQRQDKQQRLSSIILDASDTKDGWSPEAELHELEACEVEAKLIALEPVPTEAPHQCPYSFLNMSSCHADHQVGDYLPKLKCPVKDNIAEVLPVAWTDDLFIHDEYGMDPKKVFTL